MSVKISGKVWELELEPSEKLVLLALAEYADHEGNNVRPGNELLVAMTGLSQQTITAKIAKFTENGILQPSSDVTGRGHRREFSLDPARGSRRQYFIDKDSRKLQTGRTFAKTESYKQGVSLQKETYKQGVPSEQERYRLTEQKVQTYSGKVQIGKSAYKEENHHEPSVEEVSTAATENNPANLSKAIATVMGFSDVPEGKTAEQVNAAAEEFRLAGVQPGEVAEFEKDWYQRKAMAGKTRYVLTLPILLSDLPGWSRARRIQSNDHSNGKTKPVFCGRCNNGWLPPSAGEVYAKQCQCSQKGVNA